MTIGIAFALTALLNIYTYRIPSRKLAIQLFNYNEETTTS